jgi:hypothetical protein
MKRLVMCGCLSALLILIAAAAPLGAQDVRGGISGTVTDKTGGVLPGVTVTVTNTATRVAQTVVTDEKGLFRVLYLNPGTYAVELSLQGFKKVQRTGYEVRVGETMRLDLALEQGVMAETVQVTAESPLLNTTSGVSGTTIDSKQIAQLPLGDGTAYMLTRLAPGIVDASDLHFARPMDNANLGGIITNGVQGGNEFTIDGAPNLSNAKGVGFSPPSDAIAQFKVQTNAFDAQSGHTAGANVNLAIKSGSNSLHSASGYFNRDSSRSSTPLLTVKNGGSKPTRTYNRFTQEVDGPIFANRTFFMGAYEYLRDVQPEPALYTVPTMLMRTGNFTEFAGSVFDPATVTSGGVRTAFGGNVIPPGRINPVAAAYASLYPEPNRPGTSSNYFTNGLRPYDYKSYMGRIDHQLTDQGRLFGTVYYNKRREDRFNWAMEATNGTAGVINNFAVTQGYDYRSNTGVSAGYTSVQSASLLLDVRGSVTRFGEWRDPAQTFDPATLGFSPGALQVMNGYGYLPFFTFGAFSTTNSGSTIASLGSQRSDWNEGFDRPMTTISILPTATKLWGQHTSRIGYELRRQQWNITAAGYPGGRYMFNGAYTRATNGAATNIREQVWAQFLLGLPTSQTGAVATPGTQSSQFEIASPGSFRQVTHGIFVQDDWRFNKKLTLNLGLRLEVNGGMSEAENRNLAGFDTTTPNPIQAQAQANYAANPIPQIAPADFRVLGGLRFANGPVNNTATKLLPRAAGAYSIDDRTVVRAGVGMFSYDWFFENINQAGFAQSTPIQVTTDNGITFTGADLTNPLPGGQLIQPVGSANGLASQLGQNLGTLFQPDRESPYYTRWEMSVQRDLGLGFVAQVTYLGSRGHKLPVVRQSNNIPLQYLSTSRERDLPNDQFLTQNVTSPFTGLLVGSGLNGAQVQRLQLLRPFPEFGTFAIEEYTGSDRYNAVTLQLEKRFRSGNSLTLQYTHSSLRDKLNFLNPADGILEDRVSPNDRPNRFSIGSSVRVPFGKGERWGTNMGQILDAVLGGWQVSGTYQYQSGFPLTWNTSLYFDPSCNPASVKSFIGREGSNGIAGLDTAAGPGWDTSCFYFHDAAVQTAGVDNPTLQRNDVRIQLGNNVRYMPSTFPNVRADNLHLFDFGLFKNFSLPHRTKLQIRFEAINALNYTVLFTPDQNPRNATFGFITTDRNNPRDLQIGLRFTF